MACQHTGLSIEKASPYLSQAEGSKVQLTNNTNKLN